MSESRIDAAIAEYLQAAEAGAPPQRDAWLAKYPDLQVELNQFLADQSAFQRIAEPLDPDKTVAPMIEAAVDSKIVRYFGDYELIEEIARGGMGVVWKARQVSLNRLVAVKMILAGQLASDADVQRFHAEAEAAANLDHPNILPIYEVGTHEGQHYFSMKLIECGSLADLLRARSASKEQTVEILVKVCRAVHFAHQRGILHRDLKPANILLDREQTPYVTDFGLAKKVETDSALTRTGAIVGTPSYMAPEQARADKQLTAAVDVYSLGAILYELLTGGPPYKAATQLDTILQVIEREPIDPRKSDPKADRDLSVIALKCLEKEAAKRYGSAALLAEELGRWLRDEPIQASSPGPFRRTMKWTSRNPLQATAAIFGFMLIVAGALSILQPALSLICILIGQVIVLNLPSGHKEAVKRLQDKCHILTSANDRLELETWKAKLALKDCQECNEKLRKELLASVERHRDASKPGNSQI
jgi:serine/threonine protein kinase